MIQLSENLIYIVGGWQNGTISNKTWIFDTTKGFDIKEGPSMNKERSLHSCGKMNINGKIIFVVAGGIGSKCNLDSVEILDPCYFGNRWKLGMCYFSNIRLVFISRLSFEATLVPSFIFFLLSSSSFRRRFFNFKYFMIY